jgi:hypothetical protein
MEESMIRICCSKYHIGDRKFGEKEPIEDKSLTHGFCPRCFELEAKDVDEVQKQFEKVGSTRNRGGKKE